MARSGTSYKVDGNYGELDLAVLHAGGWYDVFLGGTLHNFMGMRAGRKTRRHGAAQRLLIGPWDHMTIVTQTPVGEYDPGVRSWHGTIDFDGIHLRFYDRHLRDMDNGVEDEPPVRIFVMGENRWRLEHEWPLARTRVHRLLLAFGRPREHAQRRRGTSRDEPRPGAGRITSSTIRSIRCRTAGGGLCCNEAKTNGGQFDQRAVEARPDVLCYTSEPLERDLEVTGPITVTLFAATSAVDTDWTAKLVDVCPCGCVVNLTDGIMRARYRNGTGATRSC